MQPSSAAVLCTVLVAVLFAADIPGSHAATTPVSVTMSAGSGEKLIKKVAQMRTLGFIINERTVARRGGVPGPTPLAVCGKDTSVKSSLKNVCKIYMNFSDGTFTCSGWVVSPNMVALAGQCIVGGDGWASAVYVKCGNETRYATHMTTTGEYYTYVNGTNSNGVHWSDAGMLRLNSPLPRSIKPWKFLDGSCKSASKETSVTVAGYPTVTSGQCNYNGFKQWSSTGSLLCKQDKDGFYRTDIDSCGGGGGSVLYNQKRVAIGIYVVERANTATGLCAYNAATRILDNARGGVNSGRGVSIRSLIAKLPV